MPGGIEPGLKNISCTLHPSLKLETRLTLCLSEAKRLRLRYPGIQVAPMLYRIEDNLLYLIDENAPTK